MGGALRSLPSRCELRASALALDVVVMLVRVKLVHWCLSGSTHIKQYQLGQCSQVYLYIGLPWQIVHRECCQFRVHLCAALLKSIIAYNRRSILFVTSILAFTVGPPAPLVYRNESPIFVVVSQAL